MMQTDEKQQEVVTLLPSSKINLHDAHAIRIELAKVYRDMRSGKIEAQDGTRLGYMLNLLLKAYETCVLQDKIESIETTINVRQKDEREEIKRSKNLR